MQGYTNPTALWQALSDAAGQAPAQMPRVGLSSIMPSPQILQTITRLGRGGRDVKLPKAGRANVKSTKPYRSAANYQGKNRSARTGVARFSSRKANDKMSRKYASFRK
jgi:hypothetical protein